MTFHPEPSRIMGNWPLYIARLLACCACAIATAHATTQAEAKADPLAGVRVIELARREVWQGGRRLTYIRIAPPILPARPVPVAAPQPEPTPEQLAAEAARAAKTYVNVTLMGVVYVGDAATPTITEIRWQHQTDAGAEAASEAAPLPRRRTVPEVRQLRAFVPFDLRHIPIFTQLETATHVYDFSLFLSPVEIASLREDQRPLELALFPPVSAARAAAAAAPAYLFDGTEAAAQSLDATLSGLELLLAHADLNRAALAADFARLEAEDAKRTRQAKLNPPSPKNETTYFWKITP